VSGATTTAEHCTLHHVPANGFATMRDLGQVQDVLAILSLSHEGHAGRGGSRVELEPHRLHIAPDALLQANSERIATMHNRLAALQ
jgi:hypothetical protein